MKEAEDAFQDSRGRDVLGILQYNFELFSLLNRCVLCWQYLIAASLIIVMCLCTKRFKRSVFSVYSSLNPSGLEGGGREEESRGGRGGG